MENRLKIKIQKIQINHKPIEEKNNIITEVLFFLPYYCVMAKGKGISFLWQVNCYISGICKGFQYLSCFFFFLFLKAEDWIHNWNLFSLETFAVCFQWNSYPGYTSKSFCSSNDQRSKCYGQQQKRLSVVTAVSRKFHWLLVPCTPSHIFFLIRHMKHFSSKSVELTILKSSFNS